MMLFFSFMYCICLQDDIDFVISAYHLTEFFLFAFYRDEQSAMEKPSFQIRFQWVAHLFTFMTTKEQQVVTWVLQIEHCRSICSVMAVLIAPAVPIVGLSASSSLFLGSEKVAIMESQVPSLCRIVFFPERILADLEGLNLMAGAWLRHQRKWIVKTESNVKREPRSLPEPPCTICKGQGKVRCNRCSGRGRLNFKEQIMLPKGEWPQWCWDCRGCGLSYCTRCLGTGEKRGAIGFHFPDDDLPQNSTDSAQNWLSMKRFYAWCPISASWWKHGSNKENIFLSVQHAIWLGSGKNQVFSEKNGEVRHLPLAPSSLSKKVFRAFSYLSNIYLLVYTLQELSSWLILLSLSTGLLHLVNRVSEHKDVYLWLLEWALMAVTCGAVSGTEEPRKPGISGPTNCNPCDIQQAEQEP
jgi:hypothetical protein